MEEHSVSDRFSLTGPISLFNYLTTTTPRTTWYRTIMRTLLNLHRTYQQYIPEQQIREAVQQQLSQEYRVERCREDLEQLRIWGNVTSIYDTENAASTIAEFIHRPLRYQPTPEGIAIENLVESLLQEQRRTGSLEQSSLYLIYELLVQLDKHLSVANIEASFAQTCAEEWNRVFELWRSLAENAALYLNTIAEAAQKGGANLEAFLSYKKVVVQYVNLFAGALLEYGRDIRNIFTNWTNNGKKTHLIALVAQHRMRITPDNEGNMILETLEKHANEQIEALERWFAEGSNTQMFGRQAEKEIEQVVRRASAFSFTRHSPLNYVTQLQILARRLLQMPDEESARQLFTIAFVTLPSLHFTETLFGPASVEGRFQPESVWKLPPGVTPQLWSLGQRSRSERVQEEPMPDRRKELQQLKEREYRKAALQQERFARLFRETVLDLSTIQQIDKASRILLEDILDFCLMSPNNQYRGRDGSTITLLNPHESRRVALVASDGILRLPCYRLHYQKHMPNLS